MLFKVNKSEIILDNKNNSAKLFNVRVDILKFIQSENEMGSGSGLSDQHNLCALSSQVVATSLFFRGINILHYEQKKEAQSARLCDVKKRFVKRY